MPPSLQQWGMRAGVVAALLHLTAYVLYGMHVWNGEIDTNIVSWGLFAGEFVVLIVYRDFARDWPKDLLNVVCAFGAAAIFFLVLYRLIGSGSATMEIQARDLWILGLDATVIVAWALLRNRPRFTRLVDNLLQIDIALSFIPIVLDTSTDPSGELPIAWIIWLIAYLFQGACVALRWDGKLESATTPLHNFFWHFLMVVLVVQGVAA